MSWPRPEVAASVRGLLGGAEDNSQTQVSAALAPKGDLSPTHPADLAPPSAAEAYDLFFQEVRLAEEEERQRRARRKRWEKDGRWTVCDGGGCVGLTNIKNTCWMNSVVQCLSHVEPFANQILHLEARDPAADILSPKSRSTPKSGDAMTPTSSSRNQLREDSQIIAQGLRELMVQLWQEEQKRKAVVPSRFHMCLTMNASWEQKKAFRAQQDAQEFLLFVLNKLHDELDKKPQKTSGRSKSPPKNPGAQDVQEDANGGRKRLVRPAVELPGGTSNGNQARDPINGFFQGKLESSIECATCGHKSSNFEDFLHLSLPVVDADGDFLQPIGLHTLLTNELGSEERLDGSNRWFCSNCNDKVDAIRKTRVKVLPEVVILHLKRFAYSMTGRVRKVRTPIELPGSGPGGLDSLNLGKFADAADGLANYDITGVVHHHGKDAVCGHYTAHCRHAVDGQWYSFNDDRVSAIHASEAWLPVEAYILCLVRKKEE